MRLEHTRQAAVASAAAAAAEPAHRWLARFAPFLDAMDTLDAGDCRARLEQIPDLRSAGREALAGLDRRAVPDAALAETLRLSLRELDALETDLRRRLGLLAPGDPEGHVDLARLRARLAEAEARREVEAIAGSTADAARLELQTSPPSWAAAAFLGLFSLGWLSFTTLHAFVMIGAMTRAFGPAALLLALFYGIFWAVGLGMGWMAFRAACRERLALRGRELRVIRSLPFWSSERVYTLARETRACVVPALARPGAGAALEVSLTDAGGGEIRLAAGRPAGEQERLVARINEYLSVQS